ncbi:sigma-70 family RNA polymerase sigma factor [Gemmata sp.]|uniref:sigma-70 family RNA polymerase sigma factor n=1 Tax=Gemmata sp. TaxID=1914242 RepID=UPI003F72521C
MLDPVVLATVLDEVAGGNRDAFWHVVRAYSLPVRSYLASQTHNMHDVDDLAQEVFLGAFRGLPTFRRGDDFGAWLRGIARNTLSVHWRRTARRNRALSAFQEEVARVVGEDLDRSAAADRADAIESLLRCINRLPDKLKQVVRAGLGGDKPAALAESLATTVGAVYNLHYRANQLLRACMQKETG